MDQSLANILPPQQDLDAQQVVPVHSAKDSQLEREQAEINYPQSVPHSEFTFEEEEEEVQEESDEESFGDSFEDALDEFLTQTVQEFMRQESLPPSLESVDEQTETTSETNTEPQDRATLENAVQILLERQRK